MNQILKLSLVLLTASLIFSNNFSSYAQRPYRVNDRQVEQLINRIQSRATTFQQTLDNSLNQGRVNRPNRENEIRTYVSDFDSAVERLKDRFRNRTTVSADVEEVLMRGRYIDGYLNQNLRNSAASRDWNMLRADLNTLAQYYNVTWDWNGQPPASTSAYPNYPNSNNNRNTCFVGTYRLDAARSDNPTQIANRAISGAESNNRDRIRGNLERRLEAPEMIALERRGQSVTIASSRAPQVTLDADGQTHTEQTAQGRNTSVMASFNRDLLTVTTSGNRGSDYSVRFEPNDNCRRLRVTRTISNARLAQPVTSQSVYEKISDRAQFDMYASGNEFPPTNDRQRTSFAVPDGTEIIAVLDTDLNTKEAREGDYFTMTVRSPRQYEGAVIEGSITSVERSGRVTGRAGVGLNFERIRLRNGQTNSFAATLESARTVDGENVRVDAEGNVQNEKSQTRDTVTRSGVGAALGAIIGAIAGGGKGAAIGATVGAGAGAGSVIVQGRDDLELKRGTELTIRASAPR